MPGRKEPLVTDEIYHVYNKGISYTLTFKNKRDYQRAIKTINFYRFAGTPIKLSRMSTLSLKKRTEIMQKISESSNKLIDILSYCLMPDHFHLLLRQLKDGGISKFMSQFQNSFTRYFNTKRDRVGPLFLDKFKAKRIATDELLLHVHRYIHLNPYSSFLIKSVDDLPSYPWSSLPEYLSIETAGFCERETILSFFKNTDEYKEFLINQADYQRHLQIIKRVACEELTKQRLP